MGLKISHYGCVTASVKCWLLILEVAETEKEETGINSTTETTA